jgi:hypothetical protein
MEYEVSPCAFPSLTISMSKARVARSSASTSF